MRRAIGIKYEIWYPIVEMEVTATKAVELQSWSSNSSDPVMKPERTAKSGILRTGSTVVTNRDAGKPPSLARAKQIRTVVVREDTRIKKFKIL
jgi:hypothetical protein